MCYNILVGERPGESTSLLSVLFRISNHELELSIYLIDALQDEANKVIVCTNKQSCRC